MRGHIARNSAKKQPPHEAAIKNPQDSDSCDRSYGLRENPKTSWKVREIQSEKNETKKNLEQMSAFCPVRQKRSARVFISRPPSSSPEESDWGKLPPMATPAVSDAEKDIDEEGALSLLLLSRGLRDPDEEITKKVVPVTVSVFPIQVDQTTIDDVKGCGDLGPLSRDAEIRKRSCEEVANREESHGGSRKKLKLDHNWKGSKNKIQIKNGYGDQGILCPTREFETRVQDGKEIKPKLQHACPDCFKRFKTAKAVCGHQRIHSIKDGLSGTKARMIAAVPYQFGVSNISNLFDLKC